MASLKIVVGIGATVSPEDLRDLSRAGANEFYIGYVPSFWHDRFGFATSPNRRYWRDASFTCPEALRKITQMAHQCGCTVSLALNEHSYSTTAGHLVVQIADQAQGLGVDAAIVADPDLLIALHERFPRLPLHASGEMGVYNRAAVGQLCAWGARRIVLPRHLTLDEVDELGAAASCSLELEAFVMSERCCFDGAFCFPTHGYLRQHLCNALVAAVPVVRKELSLDRGFHRTLLENAGAYDEWRSHVGGSPTWLGGECGICAIERLSKANVRFLKIVGRGTMPDVLLKRVQTVRAAADYSGPDHCDLCKKLIADPDTCERCFRCYYRR